jgi:hypothetical protein
MKENFASFLCQKEAESEETWKANEREKINLLP